MEYNANVSTTALDWYNNAVKNDNIGRIDIQCREGEIGRQYATVLDNEEWPSVVHHDRIVCFRSLTHCLPYYNLNINIIIANNIEKVNNLQLMGRPHASHSQRTSSRGRRSRGNTPGRRSRDSLMQRRQSRGNRSRGSQSQSRPSRGNSGTSDAASEGA